MSLSFKIITSKVRSATINIYYWVLANIVTLWKCDGYIYIYFCFCCCCCWCFFFPSHFNCVGINGEGHTLVLYAKSIFELESVVGSCFCWWARGFIDWLIDFNKVSAKQWSAIFSEHLSSPYECKRCWSCKYVDECAGWTHYLPSSAGKKATAVIWIYIHWELERSATVNIYHRALASIFRRLWSVLPTFSVLSIEAQ